MMVKLIVFQINTCFTFSKYLLKTIQTNIYYFNLVFFSMYLNTKLTLFVVVLNLFFDEFSKLMH